MDGCTYALIQFDFHLNLGLNFVIVHFYVIRKQTSTRAGNLLYAYANS
jgi:hypothetical protein